MKREQFHAELEQLARVYCRLNGLEYEGFDYDPATNQMVVRGRAFEPIHCVQMTGVIDTGSSADD